MSAGNFLCLLIALLLAASGFIAASARQAPAADILILNHDANLRKGPGTGFQVIVPLLKGEEVVKKDRRGGAWVAVKVPHRRLSGWIHGDLLSPPSRSLGKTPRKTAPAARGSVSRGAGARPHEKKKARQQKKSPPPRAVDRQKTAAAATPPPAGQLPFPAIGIRTIDIKKIINTSDKGRDLKAYYKRISATRPKENLQKIDQRLIDEILSDIRVIVGKYARKHGITHIINKNAGSLFYDDPRFEITNRIIDLYDAEYRLQRRQTINLPEVKDDQDQ